MVDNGQINLTVQLTLHDIYRSNRAILLGTRPWIPWILLSVIMLVASSFLFTVLFSAATGTRQYAITSLFGVFFVPLWLYFFLRAFPHRTARSLVQSKPSALAPVQYSFSTSGIRSQGPNGNAELAWSALIMIRETSDQFLLYPQPKLAYVIPKRCFSGASQLTAFRDLVKASFAGKTFLGN
jgi:hypothetical protein